MKVTDEHTKAFSDAFCKTKSDHFSDLWKAALQAVFDTFPTEPTPEQLERAVIAYDKTEAGYNKMRAALKAALTEPPPKVYPYAEPSKAGQHYATVFLSPDNVSNIHIPDFMEFDYKKLEMRLKKEEPKDGRQYREDAK